MRVRLRRKLATQIDGIDLSDYEVGDAMDLSDAQARLLIAEGWAVPARRFSDRGRILEFRNNRVIASAQDDGMSQAS